MGVAGARQGARLPLRGRGAARRRREGARRGVLRHHRGHSSRLAVPGHLRGDHRVSRPHVRATRAGRHTVGAERRHRRAGQEGRPDQRLLHARRCRTPTRGRSSRRRGSSSAPSPTASATSSCTGSCVASCRSGGTSASRSRRSGRRSGGSFSTCCAAPTRTSSCASRGRWPRTSRGAASRRRRRCCRGSARTGAARTAALGESNEPSQRVPLGDSLQLADEVVTLAQARLSGGELLERIERWIHEDRSAFLVQTVANVQASPEEVANAIRRYLHLVPEGARPRGSDARASRGSR